ncbi:MAG: alpha/beta fold hydrolase, partial [Chloroflexi bacterium]|nr:alpha/beta fold hydrolase [Chloroflexota bacterium]
MQIVLDGATLSYELIGNGYRPVVLLPALGTTGAVWRHQIAVLQDRHTVITCETGGHERLAPDLREVSLGHIARLVLAVLDAVGVDEADVMGVSMGGMVAQELAIAYPGRVRSVVLVSTVCSYEEPAREALRTR